MTYEDINIKVKVTGFVKKKKYIYIYGCPSVPKGDWLQGFRGYQNLVMLKNLKGNGTVQPVLHRCGSYRYRGPSVYSNGLLQGSGSAVFITAG